MAQNFPSLFSPETLAGIVLSPSFDLFFFPFKINHRIFKKTQNELLFTAEYLQHKKDFPILTRILKGFIFNWDKN